VYPRGFQLELATTVLLNEFTDTFGTENSILFLGLCPVASYTTTLSLSIDSEIFMDHPSGKAILFKSFSVISKWDTSNWNPLISSVLSMMAQSP
jgi:hypothetical protein